VKLEEYLYPETEEAFEDLVVELVRAEFRPPLPPTRFGRKGQRQKGIDLNWRLESGSHQAAQCKDYLKTKLTRAHIDHDLALAHTLTPPLEALIFVTSGDRDSSLSEYVANRTLHNRPTVAIWFWQDVVAMLERHQLLGLLSDDWIARRLPNYLARNGLSLQPLAGAAAMGPAPDPNASALQREMESALRAGHATMVVARLGEAGVERDEALRQLLARAYFQLHNGDQVLALAGEAAPPRLRALAGVVLAQRGNAAESRRAAIEARTGASPGDLPYVVALELLAALQLDGATYEEIETLVPDAFRDHPALRGVLGDAALRSGDHDLAVEHYQHAEANDPQPSVLRRLNLCAAELGAALRRRPFGDHVLKPGPLRDEIAEIARALQREDSASLDPTARRVLQHNLGVAAMLSGQQDVALAAAHCALSLSPDDVNLWLRYLYVLTVYDAEIDSALAEQAPPDPHVALALSEAWARAGDLTRARGFLTDALAQADVSDELRCHLQTQAAYLQGPPGPLDLSRAGTLLTLAQTLPWPAPALRRLVFDLDNPALEPIASALKDWLPSANLTNIDDEDAVTLAALLVHRDKPIDAARWLPALRARAALPDQSPDPTVVPVLVDVLLATRRLEEALSRTAAWCAVSPSSTGARYRRTRALYECGDLHQALDELLAAHEATRAAPVLWAMAVSLARLCGRVREVRRVLRTWPVPEVRSPSEFTSLYFALAATHDRRLRALALESLNRPGDLQAIAPRVIGLTARHARTTEPDQVAADCVVDLRHPGGRVWSYWMGAAPPPLPGLAEGTWLAPVMGGRIGDDVTLLDGPFAGLTLTIIGIKQPLRLLAEHAQQVAAASGEIELVDEDMDAIVARMRDMLLAQQAMTAQRLAIGQNGGFPAVVMAQIFQCSPRQFGHASREWRPRSHGGQREVREAEATCLAKAQSVVLDPLTLCLIVEAELEDMLGVLPGPLWITGETRRTLQEWYFTEREALRGLGTMRLGRGRKIQMEEHLPSHRLMLRRFWGRVQQFVERRCIVAPRPSDDSVAQFALLEEAFDDSTIATLATAKHHEAVWLCDELALRDALAQPNLVSAVSLQSLLHEAFRLGGAPSRWQTVRAFARLASTGRHFLAIPYAALPLAWNLASHERGTTLKALLSTVKDAEAVPTWRAALNLLVANEKLRQKDRRLGIARRKLVPMTLRSLPDLPRQMAESLGRTLANNWPGDLRPLRRAVQRWLRK
jgi:tetratricopeptide (TPR) repeat protein